MGIRQLTDASSQTNPELVSKLFMRLEEEEDRAQRVSQMLAHAFLEADATADGASLRSCASAD
eukprot:208831-Rhodomonas_salina.4